MSPEARQKIQLALLVAMTIAAIRTGYIFYQRHEDRIAAEKQKQTRNIGYSNPDYYVMPKKLYPYDLKTARQLAQQPVWVKEGYRYTYYPYDLAKKHIDFNRNAGLLLPIEQLHIKDVMMATPPEPGQHRQMMAVFEKAGNNFAVPIGFETDGQYTIYSDEMFYVEDPHALYKHWPADIWQSIEKHEVKPGMNELQADFAIGMGVPDAGGDSSEKTVHYPNGGSPIVITYHDGKAAEIKPDTSGS